jgi:hypothetical protein
MIWGKPVYPYRAPEWAVPFSMRSATVEQAADLAKEYAFLMDALYRDGPISIGEHQQALRHILKRLGPPAV